MENTSYACPFCKGGIDLNDVNVATDVALCRTCGKSFSFAMIAGPAKLDMDVLDKPPKGIKVQREYGGGMALSYHRMSPALFFLIPFTVFWSGFSMWGIYFTQWREGKFDLGRSLFGLPFLFGTIALLSLIVYLAAGKVVVAMRDGKGLVFVGGGSNMTGVVSSRCAIRASKSTMSLSKAFASAPTRRKSSLGPCSRTTPRSSSPPPS